MKMLRSMGFGTLVLFGLAGCKSLGTSSSRGAFDFVTPERADCEKAILLQTYWNTHVDCVDPKYLVGEMPRRALQSWVPCNDVERIDDSADIFGATADDTAQAVAGSRAVQASLGNGSEALETTAVRRVLDLIRKAEKSIIVDGILFSGKSGTEILSELTKASKRGVSVLVLHDAKSAIPAAKTFWSSALKQSALDPNFLALETAGPTAGKIVLGEVQNYSDIQGKRSSADRSRILLVDTVYEEGVSEFLQRVPKAFVGSRDFSDSAASNVDESVLIQGPAALAATLSYIPDIRKAGEAAKNLNKADKDQLEAILQRLDRTAQGPTLVSGQGWVAVQALESTDYRTNIDSSILSRLMAATDTIDIYGHSVDSNWPLADALSQAMARGVQVRILLELGNRSYALSNATMAAMLLEKAKGTSSVLNEENLPIRWFVPLVHKDKKKAGQLTAKTIIVDGRFVLYGSSDFDSYAWSGALRSYSVWVDDPALASQTAAVFDRIWTHPVLSIPHKAWVGAADVHESVIEAMVAANGSVPAAEKTYMASLLGAKTYQEEKAFRKRYSVVSGEALETIRRPFPKNILTESGGVPRCIERLDSIH